MATKRSPILGYNHNFRHRGRVFHVQTEDSGVDNPHVFTHMFHGGVILTSRKLEYDAEAAEETVKSLMQAQHKAVLRDLRKGLFDEKIVEYLGPHPVDDASAEAQEESAAPVEPAAAEPATPEPVAAEPAPAGPPPEMFVQFSTDSDASEPVEIHQTAPDEPGHVYSPAPVGAPVPPGASTYIQTGSGRKEAPLANTGQVPAIMDPPAGPEPVAAPVEHAELTTQAIRDRVRSRATDPPPIPSGVPRRPSRPPQKPMTRPPPIPSDARAQSARQRATQPRAATAPRTDAGGPPAGVVVSRPSVIVGAPPKVVGSDVGRPAATGPRGRSPKSSAPPPQSKPRTRTRSAREQVPEDSVFGGDLISEKSLDEVILAYLSEDTVDE